MEWNIAHVKRKRSFKRGDLLAVHRELGRDESIPSFLAHILEESIHLGRAARGPTTHNIQRRKWCGVVQVPCSLHVHLL